MARQWECIDEDAAVGPRFGQDPPPSFSAPTPAYTCRQWKRDLRLLAGDVIVEEVPIRDTKGRKNGNYLHILRGAKETQLSTAGKCDGDVTASGDQVLRDTARHETC